MENRETIGFLKELTEAKGISGNEKEASRVMKRYLEGYADSFEYDNLGSLIAVKKGGSDLRVMLSGHLDEVGFIVSKIEEDGYLRISAKVEEKKDDEESNYLHKERYYGECTRSFYVGEDIKEEEISAEFNDGILKIDIPKKDEEETVPEKKQIEIK